jgi:hypothetical protein
MNLLLVVGRLDTRSTLEMDLIAADVKYTFNKIISDTRLFMIAGRNKSFFTSILHVLYLDDLQDKHFFEATDEPRLPQYDSPLS